MTAEKKTPDHSEFITHIFRGKRFNDETVPVDILPELTAYRNLILAVAKHCFMQQHQGRRRVPKRFEEQFDLRLSKVSSGSTVIALERKSPLKLFDMGDVFTIARDRVNECINSVGNGLTPPPDFPDSLLRYFRGFGQSLEKDESISLRSPSGHEEITYDRAVRRRLLRASLRKEEVLFDLIGVVTGLVSEAKNVFRFKTQGLGEGGFEFPSLVLGKTIEGVFSPEFEDDLTYAFRNRESVLVRIEGIGRRSTSNEFQIEEVQKIQLGKPVPDGPDLEKRIEELLGLQDGWFDGEGKAFDAQSIEVVADFIRALCWEWDLPTPYLYPTPENNLQAEWTFGEWEVSLTFDFGSNRIIGLAVNSITDADAELDEAFPHESNQEWLFPKIGSFVSRFLPRKEVE